VRPGEARMPRGPFGWPPQASRGPCEYARLCAPPRAGGCPQPLPPGPSTRRAHSRPGVAGGGGRDGPPLGSCPGREPETRVSPCTRGALTASAGNLLLSPTPPNPRAHRRRPAVGSLHHPMRGRTPYEGFGVLASEAHGRMPADLEGGALSTSTQSSPSRAPHV